MFQSSEKKQYLADLRREALGDAKMREIIQEMEKEATEKLPSATLTGRDLAIALFDMIDPKADSETRHDEALKILEWLEVLDRDEAARKVLDEYSAYLCDRIGSGKITNKEYERYEKMGLLSW